MQTCGLISPVHNVFLQEAHDDYSNFPFSVLCRLAKDLFSSVVLLPKRFHAVHSSVRAVLITIYVIAAKHLVHSFSKNVDFPGRYENFILCIEFAIGDKLTAEFTWSCQKFSAEK